MTTPPPPIVVISNRGLSLARWFGSFFSTTSPALFSSRRDVNGEMRVATAERINGEWNLSLLYDKTKEGYGSQRACRELVARAKRDGKNILFFVHGYNNSLEHSLDTAATLQQKYNAEVVLFSWPANGDSIPLIGAAVGLGSYFSDKLEARNSTAELLRALQHIETELAKAEKGRVFAVFHSMGNYLLKSTIETHGNTFINLFGCFDGVLLAASDVVTTNHQDWVDALAQVVRVVVAHNDNDYALAASEHANAVNTRGSDRSGVKRLGNDTVLPQDNPPSDINSNTRTFYVDCTPLCPHPSHNSSHNYFHSVDKVVEHIRNAYFAKFQRI